MIILKAIPHIFTSLNLLCGVLGIINIFQGEYKNTIIYMLFAMFFDFFDGFLARLFKVSGDFGKELDSLADCVTFGVLPSLFLFQWFSELNQPIWLIYSSLLIAIFSALRLAKFNLDDSQSAEFKGLPTPANAFMIVTLYLIKFDFANFYYFGVFIVITSCLLLVSNVPMIALKISDFGLKKNFFKYLLIFIIITLTLIFREQFLPYLIPTYIIFSFIKGLMRK